MVYQSLIALSALWGAYFLFGVSNGFARLITVVLIIGIGVTFISGEVAHAAGFGLFILGELLATLYAFGGSSIKGKRWATAIIAFPPAVGNLFAIFHWPYINTVGYMMILPVLMCSFIATKKRSQFVHEAGFIGIIAMDALIKLLMAVGV